VTLRGDEMHKRTSITIEVYITYLNLNFTLHNLYLRIGSWVSGEKVEIKVCNVHSVQKTNARAELSLERFTT
jgi:hypothetical protein